MTDLYTDSLGLLGIGPLVENVDWRSSLRQDLVELNPDGDTPMTAMLSRIPSEVISVPSCTWRVKQDPNRGGLLTLNRAISTGFAFTKANLTTASTSTSHVAGDVLFLEVTSPIWLEVIERNVITLRNTSAPLYHLNAVVLEKLRVGATYGLKIALTENDDSLATANTPLFIHDADHLLITGDLYSDASPFPQGHARAGVPFTNWIGRWKNAYQLTDEERNLERISGKPIEAEKKFDTLTVDHRTKLELAFWFSNLVDETSAAAAGLYDDDGNLCTSPMGFFEWVETYGGTGYYADYSHDRSTAVKGKKWAGSDMGGLHYVNDFIANISTWFSGKFIGLCGSGVVAGMTKLAQASSDIVLQPGGDTYGISVKKWVTDSGVLPLVTQPLWNKDPILKHRLVICPQQPARFRPFKGLDTKWDDEARLGSYTKRTVTTVGTFEFKSPKDCAYIDGIGVDNAEA